MATIPTAAALDLMYRSSTTGAPTAEFDRLGGYAAVKAAAEAAGYSATPKFIQSYEVANNLPNSAAAQSQGQQAPTQDELAQMMRDSNNQRLNEVAQAQQQAAAAQAQQQAAAQQAAAQQAAVQAVQRAAQARSTGLLDVAPRAAATAGPAINRPTAMMQPSYAQVAPAQITNRAITGTPYSSIYSPATMRQNAPTLASVQAAARSSNPYAALMALSQQQSMPGSYAGPAGATAANPYLGGYNPSIYQLPPATGLLAPSAGVYSGGGSNAGDARGPGSGNAAGGGFTGSTNIGGVSGTTTGVASAANSLAAILGNLGLTSISDAIAKNVDPNYSHEGRGATGGGVDPQTGLQGQGTIGQTGLYGDAAAGMSANTAQQGFRAAELADQNLADQNAFTGGLTGLLGGGQLSAFDSTYAGMISDAKMEAAAMAAANAAQYGPQIAATAANVQAAQDAAAFSAAQAAANAAAADAAQAASDNADNPSGGYDGGYSGGYDGGGDPGGGGGPFAKGGMVNMKPQMHNPPGPDDGYAALQNGEYVIRKSAVKKYGSNIFEQINAGRIPAQRLKSLLE